MKTEKQAGSDVVVIGAGAAGSSCALWLKNLGIDVLLIDQETEAGGVLNQPLELHKWIILFDKNAKSPASIIQENLAEAGVPTLFGRQVISVLSCKNSKLVEVLDQAGTQQLIPTKLLVIATGSRPRRGEIASAEGVYFGPGKHLWDVEFNGKRVAILGGGDNAFEHHSWVMKRGAQSVSIHARSIKARRNVRTEQADRDVVLAEIKVDSEAKTVNGIPYDIILVFYGWEPNIGFALSPPMEINPSGFPLTLPDMPETSVADVFVCGDFSGRGEMNCLNAMAEGAAVAKAIAARLQNQQ